MISRQRPCRALYGFACSGDREYLRAVDVDCSLGMFGAGDDTGSEIAVRSLQSDIDAEHVLQTLGLLNSNQTHHNHKRQPCTSPTLPPEQLKPIQRPYGWGC